MATELWVCKTVNCDGVITWMYDIEVRTAQGGYIERQVRKNVCTECGQSGKEWEAVSDWGFKPEDWDSEPTTVCVACGASTDYCLGHGEMADPVGFALLQIATEL